MRRKRVPTGKVRTTTQKVLWLIENVTTKTWLSEELGISRPSLDNKIRNDSWKKLEIERIRDVYKFEKNKSYRNIKKISEKG